MMIGEGIITINSREELQDFCRMAGLNFEEMEKEIFAQAARDMKSEGVGQAYPPESEDRDAAPATESYISRDEDLIFRDRALELAIQGKGLNTWEIMERANAFNQFLRG